MKPTLIIVDAQYDFAHPDGSLYVPNADVAVEKIIEFIKLNHSKIGTVVFTKDNHPQKHCSFDTNGGKWPSHCVHGTHGADILQQLIDVCKANGITYKYLRKGENPNAEEYTAFSRSHKIGNGIVTILRSETHAIIVSAKEFIVCGFAGDYCVKDSIADLGEAVGMENVKVFRDGVADIDGGATFNNFIIENNITAIDVNGTPITIETKTEPTKEDNTETIYMVANIKAYKGRVIPLTLHKSGESFEWLCENVREGYSVTLDASDIISKKHEREDGFGKGRYRYFSNEENAKKYMLEHGWD